jgi:Escherichia/Staphylococcus phage prohead protease
MAMEITKKQEREYERRSYSCELRAADNKELVFEGIASPFNSRSYDLGGFTEIVKPGAFRTSLENQDDVRALIDHDSRLVMARTKSGTLDLLETDEGLAVTIRPANTSYVRDIAEVVRRGDVDQMSIGFFIEREEWDFDDETERVTRTIFEVQLFDVSIVTYPAFEETLVALRSFNNWKQERERKIDNDDYFAEMYKDRIRLYERML